LQPWRTIFENTALGLEIHGTPPAEIEARVREKLELVGLGPWASKYPRELSGGMQQRVGLARALATDAEILLLDEPFSALDPLTRVRLQEELLRLQQQLKKTMVFVTHDVQEAMRLGSRIAIMDAGRVLQVGTPEKILFEPASELVREFMAHVNPVSVLSVRACMRPLRALVRVPGAPDAVRLDSAGKYIATLDGRGVLQGVTMSGAPATVISHEQAHAEPAGSQAIVTGPPDLPLSAIMRDLPRRPLPVLDAERRLVGVLMPDDIWRAFTAQPEVNETNLLL
ncbi:MAG TPA: ATP-binding cassette domain-containing protein, partial [Myxococcota bacterium]|nr:ATP-binding cassette domain-containing protein [Myxococcota bacterium]